MTATHKKIYSILSYLLIVISLFTFVYGLNLVWEHFRPARFSELNVIADEVSDNPEMLSSVQLLIAARDIHVPLIKGSVINDAWQLSNDAGLVIQSSEASESAIIVYGHNYERILGKLPLVEVGDSVELVLNDWSKQQFEVTEVKQVSPDEVGVLFSKAKNDLIIYTCTGFLDTKRLVVRAHLVE